MEWFGAAINIFFLERFISVSFPLEIMGEMNTLLAIKFGYGRILTRDEAMKFITN